VLFPGPPQEVLVCVLLPVLPCPVVSDVVVVVWLFELLPTFVVLVVTHCVVPVSLVKVPPAASHSVCEGDTASAAVGPKVSIETDIDAKMMERSMPGIASSSDCVEVDRVQLRVALAQNKHISD
jgi:hypothetical protein